MASTIQHYSNLLLGIGIGSFNFTGHMKLALIKSTYVFSTAHTTYGDVAAHELAAGGGYALGGVTLGNVTWRINRGIATLNADNTSVTNTATADMGPWKYAVMYSNATTLPLMVAITSDNDITLGTNDTYRFIWASNGILRIGVGTIN